MLSHLSTGDNVRQWVSKLSEIIPHFLFQQWWLEQLLEKVSVLHLHKRTGNFGWTVNGEVILVCPAENISKINTTSGACTICKKKTVVPVGWQMERFIPTEFFRKKSMLSEVLPSFAFTETTEIFCRFIRITGANSASRTSSSATIFVFTQALSALGKSVKWYSSFPQPVFTLTAKKLEYCEKREGLSTGSCFTSCHYLY